MGRGKYSKAINAGGFLPDRLTQILHPSQEAIHKPGGIQGRKQAIESFS